MWSSPSLLFTSVAFVAILASGSQEQESTSALSPSIYNLNAVPSVQLPVVSTVKITNRPNPRTLASFAAAVIAAAVSLLILQCYFSFKTHSNEGMQSQRYRRLVASREVPCSVSQTFPENRGDSQGSTSLTAALCAVLQVRHLQFKLNTGAAASRD